MRWIHPLSAGTDVRAEVLGAKGFGLIELHRLGLPVPPGFVIGTDACRAFLRDGRPPDDLAGELATALGALETATGRRLGAPVRPLVVSVRSGAGVSMPGMMNTILNLGLTDAATAGLAAETGDPAFADDSRRRFRAGFAAAAGCPAPDDPLRQLDLAVRAVFASWNTPRAVTYRSLHGIPDEPGTAVTVQAMVFGNRDSRSGTGVAFSRDPNTGEPLPFGEVLFGCQGEDVVLGTATTDPLSELAAREPVVWQELLAALGRLEQHYLDACSVEFTVETGRLWLLQVRPGGLSARAAIRVAVDLADAGTISRPEAVRRISPRQLESARTPRMQITGPRTTLTRALGACPGVATGRVATTPEAAVHLAATAPVILVRPHTSPLDLPGLAAAAGVVTATGGPTSHAAVVARALAKPAVVSATDLTITPAAVHTPTHTLPEGTLITIDGTTGEVALGQPAIAPAAPDPHLRRLLDCAAEQA
ncbi:MAG TPA: pyruvate, phosphate dikinase [Actinophytocola sp.]|uniref:pyruvate, phosphate dikinase n=1 Tax=Actinophytocola sp. TaxID=1872138 RepID=UPI002DBC0F06|nr:pyruvate, phosphate dikinase [Actinophytocola sp.]HEU5469219.1 pyruvate, phosphate dikinase [Actinophytocola sp.]